MLRFLSVLIVTLYLLPCPAQYNWKLEKQKDGISVYLSDIDGSSYKAVKVECTLTGTYTKLINLLTDVPKFNKWIYKNKASWLMKKNTAHDFIYYSETSMPWPLSNRDAIIHLKMNTDSLPKFLSIKGNGEPDLFPEIPSKVRVPHYKAIWKVTMPSSNTIQINYFLEIDPGGNIPAWIANSFSDKGPYETFSNIAEQLKK
ncbi:MAG: START domain-containing protein [Chitinophagaceae bacterium]